MEPAQFLTAPRVTIVAGKGGVGKTTTAVALGMAASSVGLRALLVEVEDRCVRDFTSEEPCPKCGLGVSARCYGCQMVEQRKALLAEVWRVVEDVQKSIWGAPSDTGSAVTLCCHEILARLDKLVTSSNSKDSLCVEDLLDGLPRLSTEAEAKAVMGDSQALVKMREYK